jgi:tetratricopeptide (TPR) repeat protein
MCHHDVGEDSNVMGNSSDLHLADQPDWWQDPNYNSELKVPLTRAYAIVQQAPADMLSFREAGYQVIAYCDVPMCDRQRMNVYYILAMAHAADSEYSEAMAWLDRAMEIAHALGDRGAQLDLFFLRGFILQRTDQYDYALHDYREALRLHAEQRREHLHLDREQELILLIGAAAFALKQEDYVLTRRLFTIVRRAARRVPVSPLTAAWHDWFWALYLHARGKSERALHQALRAAVAFTQADGSPHDVVLIHVFAARVALDIAATHEADSIGRLGHLKMAALSIHRAKQALGANDLSGKGYIQARLAYLDALSGREARALERIAGAELLARDLSDDTLLVQALTAHGHILAQHPDAWQSALAQYRQALAISEPSSFPLEGLPARRAVRRLEEMHTDAGSNPEQPASTPTPTTATKKNASVPEQPPITPTSGHSATSIIRFSGSHVYALQPDGKRRWTVRTDGTLIGPPVVRGTQVYVTTVKGTRYTLRASDGTIFSRVLAKAKHGEEKGDDGGGGNAGGY